MLRETGLLPEPLTHPPHLVPGFEPWSPAGLNFCPALLIEVPLVPFRAYPARRPSAGAVERLHSYGDSPARGRPRRRRLRRGVRLSGYVTAALVSLALIGGTGAGGSGLRLLPGGRHVRAEMAETVRPPVVTIRLDAGLLSTGPESVSTVVFPGYLLPDEGAEEPAHAGG